MDLGPTLFDFRLQQAAQEKERRKQDQLAARDYEQQLAQQMFEREQFDEEKRQNSFRRKLELAKLQGQLAGQTGKSVPTWKDPQIMEVAETEAGLNNPRLLQQQADRRYGWESKTNIANQKMELENKKLESINNYRSAMLELKRLRIEAQNAKDATVRNLLSEKSREPVYKALIAFGNALAAHERANIETSMMPGSFDITSAKMFDLAARLSIGGISTDEAVQFLDQAEALLGISDKPQTTPNPSWQGQMPQGGLSPSEQSFINR